MFQNYNGYLELLKSKTDHAPVQQAIDQGKPLFFRVRFPYQHALPVVKRITLNNEAKCSGPRGILIEKLILLNNKI